MQVFERRFGQMVLLVLLAGLSVALWRVPIFGLLFYPFHVFGTFVHELCHGLAAVLTGGQFQRFSVDPDLSGLAWSAGGIRWIIASAGYVGSALFGGFLVVLTGRGVPARFVLQGMGLVLGLLCLLFVRNLFGIVAGLGLAAMLLLAGMRLSAFWADGLLLLLAVQMMLNALDSVFNLVWISTYHASVMTDAQIMQTLTGIPAAFWAMLWSGIALVIMMGSLQLAYRRRPDPLTSA